MECFSYNNECGICKRMCIEAFKGELAWVIDTNNKAILNLKQCGMHCYVVLSNIL